MSLYRWSVYGFACDMMMTDVVCWIAYVGQCVRCADPLASICRVDLLHLQTDVMLSSPVSRSLLYFVYA